MREFELAPIFSNHMVLQQEKPILIFGHAKRGLQITAVLTGNSEGMINVSDSVVCMEQNLPPEYRFPDYPHAKEHCNFCLCLPAQKAGGPYTLHVSAPDLTPLLFTDVMIGEVYLAGGQSNMEYAIKDDRDYETVRQNPCESVRFYQVGRRPYIDENFYEDETHDHWMRTFEDFASWSAAGYYFAENIAKEKDVCVGIIGCNFGGTSASAWQDKASLLSHEKTRTYWEEYEAILSLQDTVQYEKDRLEYIAYHDRWQKRCDAYYAEHPDASFDEVQETIGICKWPGPMGPKHEYRPCGLYETMFRRIVPYSLRGVLFYQGESDEHRPESYDVLFSNMIALWRSDFGDEKLPFLFVQLPMHKYRDNPPSESWCILREAQMKVSKDVKNTGIAVAIDCGEYNNIHPTSKAEVGRRLALLALCLIYRKIPESSAFAPCYASSFAEGNTLTVMLSHADDGLLVKNNDAAHLQNAQNHFSDEAAVLGFEICGEDHVFYPACADFAENKITLSSPKVPAPQNARYLWTEYAPVFLYGTNGLPLAPFRTQ